MSKTALLLSMLTLAAVSPAAAQSVTVGAKLGANMAKLVRRSDLLDPRSDEARIGFVAGATLTVDLGKVVGIQLEAMYAEKGTAIDDLRMRSRYLEVPILVTATLPTRAVVRPVLLAGVVASIEISCGGWTRPGYIPEAPLPPLEPLDCATMRTNRDDLGAVLGGGIELAFSRWRLTVEARYTESLTNLARHFEFGTLHNRTFAILVGTALQISGF